MRTIVHLSDLHFGRIHEPLLEPLAKEIAAIKPDVLAISGDLTMRAHTREFMKAKEFLDHLPFPKVIVPGNHDIPLYNIYSRFFHALHKYRRYISDDLEPHYSDDQMVIYGLNTARSLVLKGGRIDLEQVARICAEFDKLPENIVKIIVTHHPFDLPASFRISNLAGRHRAAMEMFLKSKVDIFLAGHTHTSLIAHTPPSATKDGYATLFIQAGTTTSMRTRGEQNSFNILELDYPSLTVKNYLWDPEKNIFRPFITQRYQHANNGWHADSNADQ